VTEETSAVHDGEKRVSWAELFFDLVFVVAVTRVSTLIERDQSLRGLVQALVAFVPIYWLWVGTAIQTNLNDVSRPALRLKIFAVALAGVFMALALPEAYAHSGLLFAAAYWAGRIVLGWRILAHIGSGIPANPYSVSIFATGPLLVVGALLPGEWRLLVWGIAALLDLSSPTLFRRRLLAMHMDPSHLAERFGLLVIIAIGESLVAIMTSSPEHLSPINLIAIALAFVVSVGLWWVYFHFAADAVRHSLETATVQLDIARIVLSYGHLCFVGAIIVMSVGVHDIVADPVEHPSWAVVGLLYGGVAFYLATFGLTRWAMFRLISFTRLGAAALTLMVLPLAPYVPAVASLAMVAVILVALNGVEFMLNQRIGWRTLLQRRATTTASTPGQKPT
jgi:low temperature requirement protein LtrA